MIFCMPFPDLTSSAHPSRRGVVRAAAWGAPAIVLASAAPAFADSGSGEGEVEFTLSSSGAGTASFFVENNSAESVELVLTVPYMPNHPASTDPTYEGGWQGSFERIAARMGGESDGLDFAATLPAGESTYFDPAYVTSRGFSFVATLTVVGGATLTLPVTVQPRPV